MSDNERWRQLKQAYDILQENERAYYNIREIRHAIIAARTLGGVVTGLIQGLSSLDVDQVSLTVVEGLIANFSQLLESLPQDIGRRVLLAREEKLRPALMPNGKLITLTDPGRVDLTAYFGRPGEKVRSCVISPMAYHHRLMGSVNLGSYSAKRFPSDLSPIYLEDLAATAALCIDNALAHELNESLAASDPLTGVYNRRYFYEHAERMFNQARRSGAPLSCLYIDLDDFKAVNDGHGHEAGDEVLKRIAQAVDRRVRRSDLFCRLGGDEFALLLPDTAPAEAETLAKEIVGVIEGVSLAEAGIETRLSASIGLATMAESDETIYDLVGRADEAMYRVKSKRKG